MGDSDDDGDYKRRDKFRSERRGYDGGGGRDGGSPPRREYRDARPGPPGGGGGGRRGGGGYEGKLSLENLLLKMDFIFISYYIYQFKIDFVQEIHDVLSTHGLLEYVHLWSWNLYIQHEIFFQKFVSIENLALQSQIKTKL